MSPSAPRHWEDPSRTPERRTRFERPTSATIAVVGVAIVLFLGIGALFLSAGAKSKGNVPQPLATAPAGGLAAAEETAAPSPAATPTDTASTAQPEAQPKTFARFEIDRAMAQIKKLESLGVRQEGGAAERRAATYIADQLTRLGYTPRVDKFRLPNGKTSQNVVAVAKGASERTIVLGAHMDSKSPSPGANDNASGCAAILELARILAETPATATVQFVWFGAEEMMDSDSNHHHFGSRHHVEIMTAAEKRATVGMISVDMIGHGSKFVTRTMERGPQSMDKLLLAQAKRRDLPMTHLVDGGSSGQSDHEAFELGGIPASWIEWRTDPVYHTTKDTSSRIQSAKVERTGQFVLDVVTGLSEGALRKLERSR